MKGITVGLLVGLLATSAAYAAEPAKPARVPMPSVEVPKGVKCDEPADIMRRDHMKFILHKRDDTMYKGVRTAQHSLKNCINCHANPKTGSVLGKDGFCASCHHYAAVKVDCFECHTDRAEKKAAAPAERPPQALAPVMRTALGHPRRGHLP